MNGFYILEKRKALCGVHTALFHFPLAGFSPPPPPQYRHHSLRKGGCCSTGLRDAEPTLHPCAAQKSWARQNVPCKREHGCAPCPANGLYPRGSPSDLLELSRCASRLPIHSAASGYTAREDTWMQASKQAEAPPASLSGGLRQTSQEAFAHPVASRGLSCPSRLLLHSRSRLFARPMDNSVQHPNK